MSAFLALLTGGSRRALERHQTLRHAVQWSYDLLTLAERIVLARAAVFAGGFTLDAAERICAGGEVGRSDIINLLDSLVRKSLVTVGRSEHSVRHGLLETIRQFSDEQSAALGETEVVQTRHAQFFAEDSDLQFKTWLSPRQHLAYEWLDRGDGQSAGGIPMGEGPRECRHRRADRFQCRGYGALSRPRPLANNRDFDAFVWAYTDLAMIAYYEGDRERAVQLAREGSEHEADRHDRFCLALLLHFMAVAGHSDDAIKVADKIVTAVEATGIPSSISIAFWGKGEAFAETDPDVALAAYEQAIAVARQSGNRFWEILVTSNLAALQARSGGSGDCSAWLQEYAKRLAPIGRSYVRIARARQPDSLV